MLIPTFVTEIARFKIINGLHLYNTLGAPIVIYVASDLMQLYIYRQFISTLPVSLDESGVAGRLFLLRPVYKDYFPAAGSGHGYGLSSSRPSTLSTTCTFPICTCPKNKLRTLTTFLMDYSNAQKGSWQTLAAGIIIIMLPTVLIYLFFQKYILAGVAAGAVKE